ncbi:uncharacterized protein [Rutidosis leptorrhynchoides]|uniref:uncharacterized protein n=1 Tax=Rutidosis leptorrhynchoides TaxID=125765 RepID=UPI003A9A3FE5
MVGKSGGQLFIWDTRFFEAIEIIAFECVIGVRDKWKSNDMILNILNVYGPHEDSKKQKLWDSLSNVIASRDEAWVLCGDFNEVRDQSKHFNCVFIESPAKNFNNFIVSNSLIDILIGGRFFTWVSDEGTKFSKIDRFLVSEKFHQQWRKLSAVALDRDKTDHCPILLKDEVKNFGPKLFKIFDVWLDEKDVDLVIEKA